ncbi:MAG: DNA-3-methyladenine glycosylase I [Desulfovibrio sp.]|jgi:DNA-3-methyladenine glycosylase I|nr:DNA-3-methyladenine glycosylase I [Desulfovibrio sp.]
MRQRCFWVPENKPFYVRYHDEEWGVPVHEDRKLFEMLVLEASQAGLSWETILRKREGYAHAFAGFDPEAVARFTSEQVEQLVTDPGIVRHRKKIEAAVQNARVVLDIQQKHGSLDAFLWDFVDGRPVRNQWTRPEDVPANSAVSDRLARELRGLGMRFLGSTTVYAFMQAVGMVNDHTTDCFRWAEL